jgi:hypothetical protein
MKMRIGILTVWMFDEQSNQLQGRGTTERRSPADPAECPHLSRWVLVLVRCTIPVWDGPGNPDRVNGGMTHDMSARVRNNLGTSCGRAVSA